MHNKPYQQSKSAPITILKIELAHQLEKKPTTKRTKNVLKSDNNNVSFTWPCFVNLVAMW